MAYNCTIKQKKCKSDGCEKYPVIGMSGFCLDHYPKLLKDEKINKHRQARNRAQQRAKITKGLHDAQRAINPPHFAPKPPKKRNTPISKFSKKRLAEIKIYSVLRKDYLRDFPNCQAKLDGCKKKATDIHHQGGRGKLLNVVDLWISVCRPCHRKITDDSKMAIEKGLSISRLTSSDNAHYTDNTNQQVKR